MPGIVAFGRRHYATGLRQEHRERIRDLKRRRRTAKDVSEVESIDAEISIANDDFKRRLKAIGRSLF